MGHDAAVCEICGCKRDHHIEGIGKCDIIGCSCIAFKDRRYRPTLRTAERRRGIRREGEVIDKSEFPHPCFDISNEDE